MRRDTLFTAITALLALHAIPIKVLADTPAYPEIHVEIIYNNPDIIEGDFVAKTHWAPRHIVSRAGIQGHITLSHSQAFELAVCYIKKGTWDGCHYPLSPDRCYCNSWHNWAIPVKRTDGLYEEIRDLLNAQSPMPLSIFYGLIRAKNVAPNADALIYLDDATRTIIVYSPHLARKLETLARNMPLVRFFDVQSAMLGGRE